MTKVRNIPHQLRLDVQKVPSSFKGRLYFVFGQGLGDTVNACRILHEVMKRYPDAEPVVYADCRWKELYQLIPELRNRPIHFYPEGRTPLSNEKGTSDPYPQVLGTILAESVRGPSLVALGNFKLGDSLARKESILTSASRAIGLSLEMHERRPYVPLSDDWVRQSESFLKSHGLSPCAYFAVAPYTWPDKMWTQDSWESLVYSLYETSGIPVLVIGVSGYPSIKGPMVREALDLPLPMVAALISKARCYIGLDTGPTHLAASYDVPIITLNPQGKFPPFLVEPNSPLRWTHLTPGIYGQTPIPMTSVFEVVQRALASSGLPPACPVCAANPYVLGAKKEVIIYLCRCGLLYREQREICDQDPFFGQVQDQQLPVSVKGLGAFRAYLKRLNDEATSTGIGVDLCLRFIHRDPVSMNTATLLNDSTSQELWWTWDAAYSFIARSGWRVVENTANPVPRQDAGSFSIVVRIVPTRFEPQCSVLNVPWGNRVIHVDALRYERWLAWGSFRKQDELEGIGWLLANEGNPNEGFRLLLLAAKLSPSWKILRRLFRAGWRVIWNRL